MSALVGDSLDADAWREADDEAESEQVRELQEQLAFLRTSDMGELMGQPFSWSTTRAPHSRSLRWQRSFSPRGSRST